MRVVGYLFLWAAVALIATFSKVASGNIVDLASLVIVLLPAAGAGLYLGGGKNTWMVCRLLLSGKKESDVDYHTVGIIAKTMGKVTMITGLIALLTAWISILGMMGFDDDKFRYYFGASLVPPVYALILNLLIFIPVVKKSKIFKNT